MLRGKKVLLGVTGSIAAYKSTFLVRLLVKAGAEVKVVLSPAARDFVTPLSLATLSKNPVLWEYFDADDEEGKWNNHVELGLWADLMLIAPATANTMAKMIAGEADNLLVGTYLSAKCPVYFAPAMDLDMYRHPSTQANIKTLQSYGNILIPAESGELASGLAGEGRLAEPENIITFLESHLRQQAPLSGKKFLINAGPTQEPIDPVRFIGNHSTGKMGIAIAEKAAAMGADVTLVLGPTSLYPGNPDIEVLRIQTAHELLEACLNAFDQVDVAILSAAVADYRPVRQSDNKIKKSGEALKLELVENPDVLMTLGKQKRNDQYLVGFALETNNGLVNAKEKLNKKNCDLIVLNKPGDQSGFGTDTNQVTLIDRSGNTQEIELKSKFEIAEDILRYIIAHSIAVAS